MQMPEKSRPLLSLVMCCNGQAATLANTLQSLSAAYQRVDRAVFEVILLENPSDAPLNPAELSQLDVDLQHVVYGERLTVASALNDAASRARGEYLVMLPDADCILSAGILRYCQQAIRIQKKCLVAFHAYTFESSASGEAVAHVQDASVKPTVWSESQQILADTQFPKYPDALFNHVSLAAGDPAAALLDISASACMMMPAALFRSLGGFDFKDEDRHSACDADIGFEAVLNFYGRAVQAKDHRLFVVLGEGLFQQTPPPEGSQCGRLVALRRDADCLGRVPPQFLRTLRTAVDQTVSSIRSERPLPIQDNIRQALAQRLELQPRPMLFVLGMHRSLTSYVARKLIDAVRGGVPGTPMGSSLRSNPQGHFEPRELVVLHNNLFNARGLSWRSLSRMEFHCEPMSPDSADGIEVQQIRAVLAWGLNAMGEQGVGGPAVIKDPRLSRFWPLWERVLSGVETASHQAVSGGRTHTDSPSVRKLLLIDHPVKVSRSLQRRDGMNAQWAQLLWARYTLDGLDALRAERGDCWFIVHRADRNDMARALADFCGQGVELEDYRPAGAVNATDAVGVLPTLFETFCKDGDATAFRQGLAAHLAWMDQYSEMFRAIDYRFNEVV